MNDRTDPNASTLMDRDEDDSTAWLGPVGVYDRAAGMVVISAPPEERHDIR